MPKSTLLKLALGAGALGAAGAAAGVIAAGRRWAAADDPDAATRLAIPEGTELTVATADGGQISGTVVGSADDDATTFVLVHGWTNDRRIWVPAARLLSDRGHRVVLYDQRGHGASRPGTDGLTIDAIAADMAAVVRHLDARNVVIAGHSMGGMAAQAFAIGFSEDVRERVAAVALVSTACGDVSARGPAAVLAPRVLASAIVNRVVGNARLGPLFVRGTLGRKATLSNLRAMQETFTAMEPAARAAFYEAMTAMDLSEGLADVDVPVLVVSGTRDQLVAPSNSRRLAELIDGARFESVPDAGHMLPLETPELIADLLDDLASSSSTSLRAAV